MEAVSNTRIYYEELYFVKMLVLIYFLNLGKEINHSLSAFLKKYKLNFFDSFKY